MENWAVLPLKGASVCCAWAAAALASAAIVWKQSDYGYYQVLMAAAAELYATSKATIGSCAARSPCLHSTLVPSAHPAERENLQRL